MESKDHRAIQFLKMIQKKKMQTGGQAKKLNRVKSEDTMPIGSLMQEIGQLKEELKSIKHGKREEVTRVVNEVRQDKENKLGKEISFVEVECISRQTQLKVEMQLGKLRRAIQSRDDSKTQKTINEILQVFNSQMKQMLGQRNRFKLQMEELIFIYDTYRKEEEEKYRIVTRNNQKLQQQVDILKREVMRITEEEDKREAQQRVREQERVEDVDRLVKENQELYRSNHELEGLIEEWELQCRALKQKCLSYEKSLQNKSQEMAFLEQDIKYLRLQSQKFKGQKKEIQKLWEKSTQQAKELKRAMQEQLDRVQREKNKWMNECSLRKQESQQIQAIESHKSLLFKQIQELRNSFTLKCKELAENKSLLHQTQRKMISLESENYKMNQQREKAKRQSQFWQKEMQTLRAEVQELRSLQAKSGEVRIKTAMTDLSNKKVRQQKLKALEDIHSLIRKHQYQIDETD